MGDCGGIVFYGVPVELSEDQEEKFQSICEASKKVGIFRPSSQFGCGKNYIVDMSTYRTHEDGCDEDEEIDHGIFINEIKHNDQKIIQFAKDNKIEINTEKIGWYLTTHEIY